MVYIQNILSKVSLLGCHPHLNNIPKFDNNTTQYVGTGPGSLTIVFTKLQRSIKNSTWYINRYTTMPNVANLLFSYKKVLSQAIQA